MQFEDPFYSFLFLSLPLIFYLERKRKKSYLRFSNSLLLKELPSSFRVLLSKAFIFLRLIILALFIFALMRPRLPVEESKMRTEGVDIVLAIDCSSSMLAEDFKWSRKRRNRLEVVKEVVKDFIKKRKDDRIGLVAFAARAYIVSPLTLDKGWVLNNLERIKVGMIEDGTAIGSGIVGALNRLKDTEAKSKIVILLTDGRNNTGKISPLTAAEAAKALGIKVYTIGAGSKGYVPYPVRDFFGNLVYQRIKIDLDEDTLKKIAQITRARYYRATDTQSLKKIYGEIDRLEKSPIEEQGYLEYKELFGKFLVPALFLLLIEVIVSQTVLIRLP